jgi:hypothetical protein
METLRRQRDIPQYNMRLALFILPLWTICVDAGHSDFRMSAGVYSRDISCRSDSPRFDSGSTFQHLEIRNVTNLLRSVTNEKDRKKIIVDWISHIIQNHQLPEPVISARDSVQHKEFFVLRSFERNTGTGSPAGVSIRVPSDTVMGRIRFVSGSPDTRVEFVFQNETGTRLGNIAIETGLLPDGITCSPRRITIPSMDADGFSGADFSLSVDNPMSDDSERVIQFNFTLGENCWSKILKVSVGPAIETDGLQNWPNPFNRTTNFGFKLSKAAYVSLNIYNILGQEVGALATGVKHPGFYTVPWNAPDLPSGEYFCRMMIKSPDPNCGIISTSIRKILMIR